MEQIDLSALNELTTKVDSGLAVDNAHLITEEYNVLLSAVKVIGAAVNQIIGGAGTKVTINASVNTVGAGTVSGAGQYDAGASVTLTATAASGYTFVKWTDADGSVVSTSATYTFIAATGATYIAVFEAEAVGDVTLTMTGEGKITNMSAVEDTILYKINSGNVQTYTSATGDIQLNNNDTITAYAKNSTTQVTGDAPIVTITYDADANTITATSAYDMTVGGINKGKTLSIATTAGTTTIVCNGRTSTIEITNE